MRRTLNFIKETFSLCIFLPLVFMLKEHLPDTQKPETEYPNYCNFKINSYRGSTKRDVVLFSADIYHVGLELAVKSLRSAGSQCRIVLLSAKTLSLSFQTKKLFKTLDVEVFDNCSNVNSSRDYVPHMLRFEFEKQWIEEHRNEIDRVFHSDAFDVYFQKDPFGPDISNDKITFVLEPHAFRSCGWNLAWMTDCYGSIVMQQLNTRFIICSGSIIGGADPYLKLINLMMSQKEWSKCWKPSYDQPIVNFLVWSGAVDKAGIQYELTGCNGNYLTMQWCLTGTVPFNKNGRITSMIGSVPAFVHQYNRNKTLTRKLHRQCGDNY